MHNFLLQTIKWNTPSAPLLTSLLRSRNTIPANRTVTTIASLLQSTGGTSRTRSGKILPLTSSVRTTSTQGNHIITFFFLYFKTCIGD